MVANDDLRLLEHIDDDEGQGLVALIPEPAEEDPPELLPVDGVVCLLEVN